MRYRGLRLDVGERSERLVGAGVVVVVVVVVVVIRPKDGILKLIGKNGNN